MSAHEDYVARGYCDAIEADSGAWCNLPAGHLDAKGEPSEHVGVVPTEAPGDEAHGDFEHEHAVRWLGEDLEADLGDPTPPPHYDAG